MRAVQAGGSGVSSSAVRPLRNGANSTSIAPMTTPAGVRCRSHSTPLPPVDESQARTPERAARGPPGRRAETARLRHRGENCKRDDRRVEAVDALARRATPCSPRRAVRAGAYVRDARLETRHRHAPPRARSGCIDGSHVRCFKNSLRPLPCATSHLPSPLAATRGAILRLDDDRRALVVSTGKNSAWVALDGEPHAADRDSCAECTGKRFMPVPGDVVTARLLRRRGRRRRTDRTARVGAGTPATGGRVKTMAANVDTLVTVTALAASAAAARDPRPAAGVLPSCRASRRSSILPSRTSAKRRTASGCRRLYRCLGYDTIVVNPKPATITSKWCATGSARPRACWPGTPGVGKSTIFPALGGDADRRRGVALRLGPPDHHGARLYRIGDGFLIDSPGVNEFGLGAIDASELTQGFPEMREPAQRCRFADCSHRQEPGCAVLAALAAEEIPATRYASYAKILAG